VKLDKPALTAHVLEAGGGEPLLLLHGGIATACHFAPLIGSLQQQFHVFAADRPGCGLTDKINYRGVSLREHAVDFVAGVMNGLQLPKAAIVANSLGGYWALLFALAHPERVTKLVLIGEPAGSAPMQPIPPPEPAPNNLENMRAIYRLRVANGDRLPSELLEEGLASARLPGVSLAWATWGEQSKGQLRTYSLRPELKGLRPATLFAWGDKDYNGPPTLGQEMAAMAQHARCEVVPDAGHWAWMDQPERCARLTVEFLKSAG
jgi:pimeloyl-ACP methyl ester carboxylesterase